MDFSFSSDQEALRDLARKLLSDRCTPEHLKAIAETSSKADDDLWTAMIDAGLVGISLPEAEGGAGLGLLETAMVLAEVARTAAPVPALAAALGQQALLVGGGDTAGLATGERFVAAALHEPTGDPRTPTVTVTDGKLFGTKANVDGGTRADAFVVSTVDGLYLVAADAAGVTVTEQQVASGLGLPEAMVRFDGAEGTRLAGPEANDALLDRAEALACVMTAAACEASLKLTAEYTISRKQFERQIASFQAVSQRAADSYIDTEAIRLTAWQAVWRLDSGHPAAEQVATAKFWAAEGGARVMGAAHHLHGGMGVDRDYPLHRYSMLQRRLELKFGAASPSLARLGKLLAASATAS